MDFADEIDVNKWLSGRVPGQVHPLQAECFLCLVAEEVREIQSTREIGGGGGGLCGRTWGEPLVLRVTPSQQPASKELDSANTLNEPGSEFFPRAKGKYKNENWPFIFKQLCVIYGDHNVLSCKSDFPYGINLSLPEQHTFKHTLTGCPAGWRRTLWNLSSLLSLCNSLLSFQVFSSILLQETLAFLAPPDFQFHLLSAGSLLGSGRVLFLEGYPSSSLQALSQNHLELTCLFPLS